MAVVTEDRQITGYLIGVDPAPPSEGLSLVALVLFLWRRKLLLAIATVLGTVVAVGITPWFDKQYRAEAVVIPVDSDIGGLGIGSLAERFAGAAGGAALSFTGRTDKREALAILESRLFTGKFISERELVPVLFAKLWDAERNTWQEDVDSPPSLQDAVSYFGENVRKVSESQTDGLITLSITWTDPELAATWANEMIAEVNELIRARKIAEAQASIEQIERELLSLNTASLRQGAFDLMRTQLEQVVFARVRPNFAFQVIDPAIVPEADQYVFPSRFIAAIVGASLGGLLGLGIALLLLLVKRMGRADDSLSADAAAG